MNQVAQTILQQLGGNRFLAMTGARDICAAKDAIVFRLPRGARGGVNSVVVRLEANDTYTVLFNRRTQMGAVVRGVSSATMVYADRLQATFTEHTGLYTSL
jgi:hypothetical protein